MVIKRITFVLALWTVTEAAYMSRMAAISRMRSPVAFRPGVMLPRYPQRVATRRTPYIVYRNAPYRYAMKHMSTPTRINPFSPWKTTRLPIVTNDYDFVRPSSPSIVHPDGAIHTIPAPNLSLSEKPIVVADDSDSIDNDVSAGPKSTYEVTEKYSDQPIYQTNAKIESPIGFSKASATSTVDLQNIVRQNAALQLAAEYGFPVMPPNAQLSHLSQPTVQLPQTTIIPQQFSMQGFHGIANPHEFMHRGSEGIIIPPNALYQQDPMFLHKLQGQILQQYPAVEFIPYTPDIQAQIQNQPQLQTQATEIQTSQILLQPEKIIKQTPSSFVPSDNQKTIVQRETLESSISSIIPHAFTAKNVSENLVEIDITTTPVPKNVTIESASTEAPIPTTTAANIEVINEDHRTTPIYYAQIGQSVGNVIANGFYSAINDVKAAERDTENNQRENITTTPVPTTTEKEVKIVHSDKRERKVDDLKKNLLGSPFEKTAESVNVAYTLLRASEKEPKVNKDGEVFAGQLVEAKISEDQDFNKEKATLANRPQVRLFAVTEKRVSEATPQKTVVKAKIPPKSKLTFDDITGEPVLRIYASYVDSPAQKELLTTKLNNMKPTRKQENVDTKADTVKSLEKSLTSEIDQLSQFGLRLRSRSDFF